MVETGRQENTLSPYSATWNTDTMHKPAGRIFISQDITLSQRDIEETFIRAGGPGGQNVNKVATAVQLRFRTKRADLPPEVAGRLIALAGQRATREGDILIEASRFRTQERNREDARQRLFHLVRQAAAPPSPPRRKTRPKKTAIQRRLRQKNSRGMIKRLRGPVTDD